MKIKAKNIKIGDILHMSNPEYFSKVQEIERHGESYLIAHDEGLLSLNANDKIEIK
jgi:hypothetical protein